MSDLGVQVFVRSFVRVLTSTLNEVYKLWNFIPVQLHWLFYLTELNMDDNSRSPAACFHILVSRCLLQQIFFIFLLFCLVCDNPPDLPHAMIDPFGDNLIGGLGRRYTCDEGYIPNNPGAITLQCLGEMKGPHGRAYWGPPSAVCRGMVNTVHGSRYDVFFIKKRAVEIQLLERLWDHGTLFETWVVRVTKGWSWRQIRKPMVII